MPEVRKSIIKLSNGKLIYIRPLDARTLNVNASSVAFLSIKRDNNNDIISISLEDKDSINIGDQFKLKIGSIESIYTIKYIIAHEKEKSLLLFSSVPSKTTTFLLPLLGKSKKQLKYNSYFINAYLSKDLTHLYLLYRFTGSIHYKEFEQYMITDPLCVEHIEYDPYHVIYSFKIPKEFKLDVECFLQGKYSKLSTTLRERIKKFYVEDAPLILGVIKKDKELKKKIEIDLGLSLPETSELASKPNLDIEILI